MQGLFHLLETYHLWAEETNDERLEPLSFQISLCLKVHPERDDHQKERVSLKTRVMDADKDSEREYADKEESKSMPT